MKQAMDKDDLSSVLDRAAQMAGELGDVSSGLLTPKNYYELHMRALDDMPNLEEYFISLTSAEGSKYTMRNLYDYVQYCPRVLPRLYIQISAGSALIRSKEESATSVLNELIEAVRCVQNPLRGLFLRHFLLQVTRDKLPDGQQVQDAYEFVLTNLIEMNRLWVRIQHLPGDGKSKEQRKRRERERNELRILVGTNLVRLSQLEGVTSVVYGEHILPRILEQIIACGDPLAQAYLIDCIIQVFPDEYHIETLPILLAVCPKLRDKVNVRTIMQSLMDRLANYYADEELLDEADTNEVKKSVARDSFQMFEECVQKVFEARGPKLVSREVIRLQTALLTFSLKCFPESMTQVSRCLGVCINFIRQAANATAIANQTPLLEDSAIQLDEASITELEKMLSIPLDSLALKVLELELYSDLLQFLPWKNRHDVGMIMLRAIDTSGVAPTSVNEVEELFSILVPVIHARNSRSDGVGAASVQESDSEVQEEDVLVSKLVHLLDHENVDVAYEMIFAARIHLGQSGNARVGFTLAPVVFSALRLANRIAFGEDKVNAIPTPAAVPEPDDGEGVDGDSKNDTAGVGDSAEDIGVKETPVTDEVESKLQATALAENPELPVENAPTLRYVLFPTASGGLKMLHRSHACPSTVAGRYCSLSRALSR
jgi:vacuolar protein sorting-associated protein 35